MTVDINMLQNQFLLFNVYYFHSALNIEHIDIKIDDIDDVNTLGQINFNFNKGFLFRENTNNHQIYALNGKNANDINLSNYFQYMSPIITISPITIHNSEFAYETLLHEMIHLYCAANGFLCSHSGMFETMSKLIYNESYGHYKITQYNDLKNITLKYYVKYMLSYRLKKRFSSLYKIIKN